MGIEPFKTLSQEIDEILLACSQDGPIRSDEDRLATRTQIVIGSKIILKNTLEFHKKQHKKQAVDSKIILKDIIKLHKEYHIQLRIGCKESMKDYRKLKDFMDIKNGKKSKTFSIIRMKMYEIIDNITLFFYINR